MQTSTCVLLILFITFIVILTIVISNAIEASEEADGKEAGSIADVTSRIFGLGALEDPQEPDDIEVNRIKKLYDFSSSLEATPAGRAPESWLKIEKLADAKLEIEKAIEIGAPLYNSGNIEGCAKTYARTAADLVNAINGNSNAGSMNGSLVSTAVRLQKALDECRKTPNDWNGNAWTLRYVFDDVLAMKETQNTVVATSAPNAAVKPSLITVTTAAPTTAAPVNKERVSVVAVVTLAKPQATSNEDFADQLSADKIFTKSAADAAKPTLCGDDKNTCQVTVTSVKVDERLRNLNSLGKRFKVRNLQASEVDLEMTYDVKGLSKSVADKVVVESISTSDLATIVEETKKAVIQELPNLPAFNGVTETELESKMKAKSVSKIERKDPVAVEKKVIATKDESKTLSKTTSDTSSTITKPTYSMDLKTVQQEITNAIDIGSPLYNSGDIKGCADTYKAVAEGLVPKIAGTTPLTKTLKSAHDTLLEGLNKLTSNHDDTAWTLRGAFDKVLVMWETNESLDDDKEAEESSVSAQTNTETKTETSVIATITTLQPVKSEIENAIGIGAPLYNMGDIKGCATVYKAACDGLIDQIGNNPTTTALISAKDTLAAAKLKVEQTPDSHEANAWTLREAFDKILLLSEIEISNTSNTVETKTSSSSVSTDTESVSVVSSMSESESVSDMSSSTTTEKSDLTLANVKSDIEGAIAVGAPMYNNADIDGCARVYKETATDLVNKLDSGLTNGFTNTDTNSDSMKTARDALKNGLDRADLTPTDSDSIAWTLRYAFDSVLAMSADSTVIVSSSEFSSTDEGRSYTALGGNVAVSPNGSIVNDGVMGGLSTSTWSNGVYSGRVRTENNGGFASLRFYFNGLNVKEYDGFYIKGKETYSDSREYSFLVRDSAASRWSATNFRKEFYFGTSETTVTMPFSDSAWDNPMSYGWRTNNGWELDLGSISEFGVMVGKPVGDFSIEIAEIGVYKDSRRKMERVDGGKEGGK